MHQHAKKEAVMSMRVLAVVVLAGLLFAQPAPADDGKYVKLVNAESGKVLSVEGDSTESLARLVAAKDERHESQQWKLEKDGDYFKLTNRKSGKVIDVEQESTEEGASVIQWDDKTEGNDNQRWAKVGDGEQIRLKAKHSEQVLDLDQDGKAIQKKADEKAKSQLWKIVKLDKE
jgi:hypothetical protein